MCGVAQSQLRNYTNTMSSKAILLLLFLDLCTEVIAGAPPRSGFRSLENGNAFPRFAAIDLEDGMGFRLFKRYKQCSLEHETADGNRKIVVWTKKITDINKSSILISDGRDIEVTYTTCTPDNLGDE